VKRDPSGRQECYNAFMLSLKKQEPIIRKIIEQFGFEGSEIIFVPNIQEWEKQYSRPPFKANPWTHAMKTRRSDGVYAFVFREEIEESELEGQKMTILLLSKGKLGDEVKKLKSIKEYFFHLVLHEIAHIKGGATTDSEADEWAFKMLSTLPPLELNPS
jgi:hypothetical protein